MECSYVKFKHRKLCAGDLNRRIKIQSRSDKPSNTTFDYGQTFTDTRNTWSALLSVKGRDVFAGTNMDELVSHIFYVRYFDGLTSQHWINYRSERYDILTVEDLDLNQEWYAIFTNVRGTDTKAVNDA
jgi:SPP1 family predicted phage head-tail adaptor